MVKMVCDDMTGSMFTGPMNASTSVAVAGYAGEVASAVSPGSYSKIQRNGTPFSRVSFMYSTVLGPFFIIDYDC